MKNIRISREKSNVKHGNPRAIRHLTTSSGVRAKITGAVEIFRIQMEAV